MPPHHPPVSPRTRGRSRRPELLAGRQRATRQHPRAPRLRMRRPRPLHHQRVIPAKAGNHGRCSSRLFRALDSAHRTWKATTRRDPDAGAPPAVAHWIPACAGMTITLGATAISTHARPRSHARATAISTQARPRCPPCTRGDTPLAVIPANAGIQRLEIRCPCGGIHRVARFGTPCAYSDPHASLRVTPERFSRRFHPGRPQPAPR